MSVTSESHVTGWMPEKTYSMAAAEKYESISSAVWIYDITIAHSICPQTMVRHCFNLLPLMIFCNEWVYSINDTEMTCLAGSMVPRDFIMMSITQHLYGMLQTYHQVSVVIESCLGRNTGLINTNKPSSFTLLWRWGLRVT